jgi:superfamily II DNA or RNA helicase
VEFDEDDIEDAIGRRAAAAGLTYQRQGRVRSLGLDADGVTLIASVRGSLPQPYEQTIRIEPDELGVATIEGECTCPVGHNCKHVAAALYQALAAPRGAAGLLHPAADAPAPRARTTQLEAIAERVFSTPPVGAWNAKMVAPSRDALPYEIAEWLAALERASGSESEAYPPDVPQRLFYVLSLEHGRRGAHRLTVALVTRRLNKDGSWSEKSTRFQGDPDRHPPRHLRPSDARILRGLRQMPLAPREYPNHALDGELGAELLRAMLATGRARWQSVAGTELRFGPALPGRIVWAASTAAAQLPHVEVAGDLPVAALAPPFYVDAERGLIGEVSTGIAPNVARALLAAPEVPVRIAATLREALARRVPTLAALAPHDPGPPERIEVAPRAHLHLFAARIPPPALRFGGGGEATPEREAMARLSFVYGPIELRLGEREGEPLVMREGRLFQVARAVATEKAALVELLGRGFALASHRNAYVPDEHRLDLLAPLDHGGPDWFTVIDRHLPALEKAGWQVTVARDFPLRIVRPDAGIAAELRETTGIDWLELDLGIMVDGARVDLVPALIDLIARGQLDTAPAGAARPALAERVRVPLGDGRILVLPGERLAPIVDALHALFLGGAIDLRTRRVRIGAGDAGTLAELEAASVDLGAVWRGGERLRMLGRRLRDSGGIPPVEPPPWFRAALRPYQAQGVAWLQFLREGELGGVLADDMGLGKTIQALAHLAIEKASGRADRPSLVIAPTSLMANWRHEAERFAPELRVLTLHGLQRKTLFRSIASHDLVLTTYPLLARDHEVLTAQPWHVLVLDEAQVVKNPDAQTTRLVGRLDARHRVCLTGTPLENHLGELWSLFAFLSPGLLGDRVSFTRSYRTPIEKQGDVERRRLLARRVRPFLLRRTKAEVAAELPPKSEIVERIEMEGAQRDLYESIRLAMHARVREAIAERGVARSRIVILDALLKLRQACCDPRLLRLATASAAKANSAKLERLLEMVPALVGEGRRILLFSQFTSMLELIESELEASAIAYAKLTGDTRNRPQAIARFQGGDAPVFLISLKAGGTGLNLTAADTVIHYDPWWNPAVEDQATDRAHRIGQDKPVFVYKLVMLGSIEEKMEALKARKRELAAGLYDHGGGSTLAMTEGDIDALFAAD